MAYLARDVVERVVLSATKNVVYSADAPRDLEPNLLVHLKHVGQATFFVVGKKLAEHILYVLGEEYFHEHGSHPITDFSMPALRKDEIESGYIGVTFGVMIYVCEHIDPTVLAAVEINADNTLLHTCCIKL